MDRFRLCGIVFDSELKLPGWPVDSKDVETDVRISLGLVPHALDRPVECRKAFQAAPGAALLLIPQVARFLVLDGREIIVQPSHDANEYEVRAYLTGSVLGALLHQRGVLPLHASAFAFNNCAVALAGAATIGKSTTAAAIQQMGHEVIGDDLCPVEMVDSVPLVSPGIRRLKLRSDASHLLGLNASSIRRTTVCGKLHFDLPLTDGHRRLPLRCLYVLRNLRSNETYSITRVQGVDRLRSLLGQTFRRGFLPGLRLKKQHLDLCVATLASVDVYEFWRPRDLSQVGQSAAFLLEHLSRIIDENQSKGTSMAHDTGLPMSLESVVTQSRNTVDAAIGDELMLLSIERGRYYNLNHIAMCIWKLIEQPRSVSSICDQLTSEFEVSSEDCQKEVMQHLDHLIGEGLAKVA